jgi:hypothetical protein
MDQETYNELEKIVVKGAKDDYFLFELSSAFIGILLVWAMATFQTNIPMLIVISTGIIIFVMWYIPTDKQTQEKIKARKELMDKIKKDVV